MNLLELAAKIAIDTKEYDKGVDRASEKAGKLSKSMKGKIVAGAKIAGAAITTVATAIGALTKKSVDQYSQFEQLTGGVETLFKKSAKTVEKYAEVAYKTAGISANNYMETITSFSASLISSLGGDTAKAAEMGNMAVIDMADNAAKMGSDLQQIQDTYQSLARGNYAMLDNLKIGYGGTKAEMQRMIEDANKVKQANGEMADLSIDSFADVVEAIHIIQTEMGITGTTAQEAEHTIEGSYNSMKAAWENLLTGFADSEADWETLMDQFIEAAKTYGQNLLPPVQTVLSRIGGLLADFAEKVVPKIVKYIYNHIPQIIQAGLKIALSLVKGITQAMPEIALMGLKMVIGLVTSLWENKGKIFRAGVNYVKAFANGILSVPKTIWNAFKSLIDDLIADAYEWGKDLIDNFIAGIQEKHPLLYGAITGIANLIHGNLGFSEPKEGPLSDFHTYAPDMIDLFVKGIRDNERKLHEQVATSFNFMDKATAPELFKFKDFSVPQQKGVEVTQNIYSQKSTAADLLERSLYLQERAVLFSV